MMVDIFGVLIILNFTKTDWNTKGVMLNFGFFLTGIKSFFKITLNVINKSLKISKILLKKGFEVGIYNKNSTLIMAFILGLL